MALGKCRSRSRPRWTLRCCGQLTPWRQPSDRAQLRCYPFPTRGNWHNECNTCVLFQQLSFGVICFTVINNWGCAGGSVVKNPPTNAGDMGLIPWWRKWQGTANPVTPVFFSSFSRLLSAFLSVRGCPSHVLLIFMMTPVFLPRKSHR